jgi:hypothetical protein
MLHSLSVRSDLLAVPQARPGIFNGNRLQSRIFQEQDAARKTAISKAAATHDGDPSRDIRPSCHAILGMRAVFLPRARGRGIFLLNFSSRVG